MFDDEGALVVEDHQDGVCFNKVGEGAGEGPADVEPMLRATTVPVSLMRVIRMPSGNAAAGRDRRE